MSARIEIADTDALVVDVQYDFCRGGGLAVAGGDEVVPVINRLARGFADQKQTSECLLET